MLVMLRAHARAITDMIYSSQVATPDNMELMYQLYALASRKPLLKNGNAKLDAAQSANARTMV